MSIKNRRDDDAAKGYTPARGLATLIGYYGTLNLLRVLRKKGVKVGHGSRYMPHQGKQEMARRVRQMEAHYDKQGW